MKNIVPVLAVLILTLACSLTGPVADQIAADPTGTPLGPTQPPPTQAVPVSTPEVTVSIPASIGGTVQVEMVPDTSTSDVQDWEKHPAFYRLSLQGYPVQGTLMQPVIEVYPADEFSAMSPAAAQVISDMRSFLLNPNTLPAKMPFLPFYNASQVFRSNTSPLSFRNGSGVRYLTQFDQAPLPINNHELIYTYQGLTTDNKYYVSAVLPVNVPFLGANGTPQDVIPPDGIPFDWNNPDMMAGYVDAVRIRLESTGPEKFTPNLNELDALVQSLYVNLP